MRELIRWPKFDSRITGELRSQSSTIRKGLICVLVSALLTGAAVLLTKESVTAIQIAAPSALLQSLNEKNQISALQPEIERVSKQLNLPINRVSLAYQNTLSAASKQKIRLLSDALGQPQSRVESAINSGESRPHGNLDAIARLGWVSLAVVLLFGIKYWFTRGQTYYLSRASARLTTDLRIRLFDKLQRLPVSYFGAKKSGAIQSVLNNDVGIYQNAVNVIRDSIDGPARALVSFAVIFWIQWQLALVATLFIPPMVAIIQRNGKKIKASQASVQDDLAELAGMTNEALQGTRVVKAFSAEAQISCTYRTLVERSYQSQIRAARRFATLRPLVEFIGAVALATILYLCGWLSYAGTLQLGDIAGMLLALDQINQGLRSLSSVTGTFNQVQAAADRIYAEVLDVPEPADADTGRTLESFKGLIEFDRVTFRYPDGTEALRNVSFAIHPGTSLALVGPSGAGKSTIADLLLRFHEPSEGAIKFDGVDIKELKPSWLRNQIGVVPQQTFLFAGSVAENIRMGKQSATPEEIQAAAHAAHADEFIDTMDHGYESELGEQGIRLSGGQRQRVAIARALVRQPKILLLDEATSALDATSEKAVTEALDEIMRQRTTLFIAHRLTTAARADGILVLSHGQVLEQGTHKELMEKNGAYAGLFRAFSSGILE